jgi:hypothetical protein
MRTTSLGSEPGDPDDHEGLGFAPGPDTEEELFAENDRRIARLTEAVDQLEDRIASQRRRQVVQIVLALIPLCLVLGRWFWTRFSPSV